MSLVISMEDAGGEDVNIEVHPEEDFQGFLIRASEILGYEVELSSITGGKEVPPSDNIYQFLMGMAIPEDEEESPVAAEEEDEEEAVPEEVTELEEGELVAEPDGTLLPVVNHQATTPSAKMPNHVVEEIENTSQEINNLEEEVKSILDKVMRDSQKEKNETNEIIKKEEQSDDSQDEDYRSADEKEYHTPDNSMSDDDMDDDDIEFLEEHLEEEEEEDLYEYLAEDDDEGGVTSKTPKILATIREENRAPPRILAKIREERKVTPIPELVKQKVETTSLTAGKKQVLQQASLEQKKDDEIIMTVADEVEINNAVTECDLPMVDNEDNDDFMDVEFLDEEILAEDAKMLRGTTAGHRQSDQMDLEDDIVSYTIVKHEILDEDEIKNFQKDINSVNKQQPVEKEVEKVVSKEDKLSKETTVKVEQIYTREELLDLLEGSSDRSESDIETKIRTVRHSSDQFKLTTIKKRKIEDAASDSANKKKRKSKTEKKKSSFATSNLPVAETEKILNMIKSVRQPEVKVVKLSEKEIQNYTNAKEEMIRAEKENRSGNHLDLKKKDISSRKEENSDDLFAGLSKIFGPEKDNSKTSKSPHNLLKYSRIKTEPGLSEEEEDVDGELDGAEEIRVKGECENVEWGGRTDALFVCRLCGVSLYRTSHAVTHSLVHKILDRAVFPCIVCQYGFTSFPDVRNHIKTVHADRRSPRRVLELAQAARFRAPAGPLMVKREPQEEWLDEVVVLEEWLDEEEEEMVRQAMELRPPDVEQVVKREVYHVEEYKEEEEEEEVDEVEVEELLLLGSGRNRNKEWLECPDCKRKYDTPERLSRHKCTGGVGAGSGGALHRCGLCGQAFHTDRRLLFHRTFHQAELLALGLSCPQCEQDQFPSEAELYRHINSSHNCNFTCAEAGCGKEFRLRSSLKSHGRIHGKKRHRCDVCGKQFFDTQNLKEHKVTHLKVKPFQCHICLKFVNRRSRLRMHLLAHEARPEENAVLACRVCRMAFRTTLDAENHVRESDFCRESIEHNQVSGQELLAEAEKHENMEEERRDQVEIDLEKLLGEAVEGEGITLQEDTDHRTIEEVLKDVVGSSHRQDSGMVEDKMSRTVQDVIEEEMEVQNIEASEVISDVDMQDAANEADKVLEEMIEDATNDLVHEGSEHFNVEEVRDEQNTVEDMEMNLSEAKSSLEGVMEENADGDGETIMEQHLDQEICVEQTLDQDTGDVTATEHQLDQEICELTSGEQTLDKESGDSACPEQHQLGVEICEVTNAEQMLDQEIGGVCTAEQTLDQEIGEVTSAGQTLKQEIDDVASLEQQLDRENCEVTSAGQKLNQEIGDNTEEHQLNQETLTIAEHTLKQEIDEVTGSEHQQLDEEMCEGTTGTEQEIGDVIIPEQGLDQTLSDVSSTNQKADREFDKVTTAEQKLGQEFGEVSSAEQLDQEFDHVSSAEHKEFGDAATAEQKLDQEYPTENLGQEFGDVTSAECTLDQDVAGAEKKLDQEFGDAASAEQKLHQEFGDVTSEEQLDKETNEGAEKSLDQERKLDEEIGKNINIEQKISEITSVEQHLEEAGILLEEVDGTEVEMENADIVMEDEAVGDGGQDGMALLEKFESNVENYCIEQLDGTNEENLDKTQSAHPDEGIILEEVDRSYNVDNDTYNAEVTTEVVLDSDEEDEIAVKSETAKRSSQELEAELSPLGRLFIEAVNIKMVYRCEFCERVFCQKDALNEHRAIHENLKLPYVCNVCNEAYSTYARVTSHKTSHGFYKASPDDGPHEGSASKMSGYEEFPVVKHFLCQTCNKTFLHWTYLQVHRKHKHSDRTQLFTCKVCGEQFLESWMLNHHRRKFHPEALNMQRKMSSSSHYKCADCGENFSLRKELAKHRDQEHGDSSLLQLKMKPGPFSCTECDRVYQTKVGLEGHMRIHNGGVYLCDLCGNGFAHRAGLETHHKRVHLREQPHSCADCGQSFFSSAELFGHRRCHTGEKPFPCSFCPMYFRTKGRRNEHHRVHTGERPYPCDVCGLAFRRSHAMKNHRLIHTGERQHACPHCNKMFHVKSNLNSHIKQKHAGQFLVLEVEGGAEVRAALEESLEILANSEVVHQQDGEEEDQADSGPQYQVERTDDGEDAGVQYEVKYVEEEVAFTYQ